MDARRRPNASSTEIERETEEEVGRELPEPEQYITIRQRDAIPFREIARVAFRKYPRRAILGLSLFIGQAFLYNAVTFDLGTILHGFFDVSSSDVPLFLIVFAVSNFLGPLLLGRYFDTIGRIPMIAGTYLVSATIVAALGVLLITNSLDRWTFMALVLLTFFFASAGASSAYLTVSEIFPMETRALAIAFFFALGTGLGGIIGPELFGQFIHSGDQDLVGLGFLIGAGAMALGGVAELFFGVRAEQQSLEAIATPLTAEEAQAEGPGSSIEQRRERRTRRETGGLRRYRPGPGQGSAFYSPGMVGTAGQASRHAALADQQLDREVAAIVAVLLEHGTLDRERLGELVGAEEWGPRRFSRALHDARREGGAVRLSRTTYAPAGHDDAAHTADDRGTHDAGRVPVG